MTGLPKTLMEIDNDIIIINEKIGIDKKKKI